jgi:hypothetical protein
VSVLESITGDHQTIIDRMEEMEEGLDDIVDE